MRFKKYNMETKTDKHLSVDPKYGYAGEKLNLMSNCDTLRDCRKSRFEKPGRLSIFSVSKMSPF